MSQYNHPIKSIPHAETQRKTLVFREALADMPEPVQAAFRIWRMKLVRDMIGETKKYSVEAAVNYADAWLAEIVTTGRMNVVAK